MIHRFSKIKWLRRNKYREKKLKKKERYKNIRVYVSWLLQSCYICEFILSQYFYRLVQSFNLEMRWVGDWSTFLDGPILIQSLKSAAGNPYRGKIIAALVASRPRVWSRCFSHSWSPPWETTRCPNISHKFDKENADSIWDHLVKIIDY